MPVSETAPSPAATSLKTASARDPKEVEEARKPQPPFELNALRMCRRDFDLRGGCACIVWSRSPNSTGLTWFSMAIIRPALSIRFRITRRRIIAKLSIRLMTVTGSFIVPISDRVFMVVKDTEQKRREVENHIAVTIPIPEPVTVQEAQELGRSVQQLMEIQRFSIDSAQRLVIFRDRASKVRPAQAVLEQMLMHKPQIALEVELHQRREDHLARFGLSPAHGLSACVHSPILAGISEFHSLRLFKLPHFRRRIHLLGIGLTSAQLLATWSKSVGQSILAAQRSEHWMVRRQPSTPATSTRS